jgi:hypothetical protein
LRDPAKNAQNLYVEVDGQSRNVLLAGWTLGVGDTRRNSTDDPS